MTTVLVLITLVSVVTAMAAVAIAWRTVANERRRADARVAALAASLHAPPDEPIEVFLPGADDEETGARPMFGGSAIAAHDDGVPRGFVAVAAGMLLVVGLATTVWVAAGRSAPAQAGDAPAAASLELVSLAHSRTADTLTVTGLVRNPAQASPVEDVSAVVFFFDPSGRFLSSARAPLDFRKLAPGDESPFTIAVAAPAGLGRYRVSFRRSEGGIVPHVDRRQAPAAIPASASGRASL